MAIHNSSATDPVYQANPTHNTARKSYYGITAYPTVMVDGLYDAWPLSTMLGYYETRMAVPCHLDITLTPSVESDPTEGTITFTLTTDTGIDTDATIHAIINECGIPGTGTYTGSEFNYALRWNMFGANGTAVDFGSSGETIELSADYTINPSWDWEELYLTTFVQSNATDEILNSRMVKLSEIITTGIEEEGSPVPNSAFIVNSPAEGAISFTAADGTVSLFSLDGRLVDSMRIVRSGSGVFMPEVPGLYILRHESPQGVSQCRPVVLIR